jgi:hypothetical protein
MVTKFCNLVTLVKLVLLIDCYTAVKLLYSYHNYKAFIHISGVEFQNELGGECGAYGVGESCAQVSGGET